MSALHCWPSPIASGEAVFSPIMSRSSACYLLSASPLSLSRPSDRCSYNLQWKEKPSASLHRLLHGQYNALAPAYFSVSLFLPGQSISSTTCALSCTCMYMHVLNTRYCLSYRIYWIKKCHFLSFFLSLCL